MSPVTTRRRPVRRADGSWRAGTTRCPTQPATLFDAAPKEPAAPARGRDAAGSGETLDRILVGDWERLANRAPAPCPLCGGTMEPIYGAHPTPIGGRCRDCETTLS